MIFSSFQMDLYQDDSGSDGGSIALEIERGDAVIMYGCSETRYSPPANHVTKVLIGPRGPSPSVAEITIFTNDTALETVTSSGRVNHNLGSPFGPSIDCGSPQIQTKPYKELAEALSHVIVGGHGMEASQGTISISPALSRKFRNSTRSKVLPPSKNPFLADSTPNSTASPIDGSHDKFADPSITVPESNAPVKHNNEATLAPQSVGSENIIDPPGAFQIPDLLGDATKHSTSPTESVQDCKTTVSAETASPKVCPSPNSESNSSSSANVTQITTPDVVEAIQPAPNLPDGSGPRGLQIVNTASSQELPPIQESLNTPVQSESSFHFPEPPRAKEVKFEEPPEHKIVSALETLAEKLGEIVPITVQPSHTTKNIAKRDEPNVIVLPAHSVTQFQTKPKDGSNASRAISNHTNNTNTQLKTNNLKVQEAQIPVGQAGPEEHEHSYGIIGNEDNLSEITLPPLTEGGANHRDHEGGPCNNGHPCQRIRISMDQQSATPPRRAMAVTGLLVVLLISTIVLLVVYKFVHKTSPD